MLGAVESRVLTGHPVCAGTIPARISTSKFFSRLLVPAPRAPPRPRPHTPTATHHQLERGWEGAAADGALWLLPRTLDVRKALQAAVVACTEGGSSRGSLERVIQSVVSKQVQQRLTMPRHGAASQADPRPQLHSPAQYKVAVKASPQGRLVGPPYLPSSSKHTLQFGMCVPPMLPVSKTAGEEGEQRG